MSLFILEVNPCSWKGPTDGFANGCIRAYNRTEYNWTTPAINNCIFNVNRMCCGCCTCSSFFLSFFLRGSVDSSIAECCIRCRYQGRGQTIISHNLWRMQLLVPALDICFCYNTTLLSPSTSIPSLLYHLASCALWCPDFVHHNIVTYPPNTKTITLRPE